MTTELFRRHLSRLKGGDNMKLTFHLIKAARKSGGDRYEADVEGEPKPVVFYFPQTISRPGGSIKPVIELEIKED